MKVIRYKIWLIYHRKKPSILPSILRGGNPPIYQIKMRVGTIGKSVILCWLEA